jgi:KipI family sensor histidine kinase inhibitor
MADGPTWRSAGDRALLWEAAGSDLATRNLSARSLHRRLAALRLAEVEDLIAGAATVLVLLRAGVEPSATLLAVLRETVREAGSSAEHRVHEIEVGYGGLDLGEVARLHGLAERDVVERHSGVSYTVGFLGFAPGFAYLLGLPESLATPRLATPRTRVPAGSVAIGGQFTAVYPRAAPGGWRVIGQADVSLFDPGADPPARLLPGDHVKFVAR